MLKVGLIGCGFMGTMHANCYKNIEGVELSAVADIRPEKANEIAQGTNAQIFADGKDLIANAQVDVIDICLPTYLHAEYALLAMDKVNYLFVEKPVTLTVEESDALLAKSAQTGCQVQVGQAFASGMSMLHCATSFRKTVTARLLTPISGGLAPARIGAGTTGCTTPMFPAVPVRICTFTM